MATKTTNLDLNKPAGTDIVDIDVLNENMDILDSTVGTVQELMETVQGDLSDVQEGIQTAQQDISDIEEQLPEISGYAESAKENADKAYTYYQLSKMQAATGGFLQLVNRDGRIYCIRTANCGLEMKMEEGRLYYGYTE